MTEMTSKTIVAKMQQELRERIAELKEQPSLAVVLVGNDRNSLLYVTSIKKRHAEDLSILYRIEHMPEESTTEEVLEILEFLNNDPTVTGIIVQLPLPKHIDTDTVLDAVAAQKDVDGLRNGSEFTAPIVDAIMMLLHEYAIALSGQQIVVVGNGKLVGAPLSTYLRNEGYAVNTCDNDTKDLKSCTLEADILISATGKRHLITPEMVKEGAVVIDVDCDVEYDAVKEKASYITPQRGAVGPLTVLFLLNNVVLAAEQRKEEDDGSEKS
jgi:methylenetetrahydrofolate dehydrogenase (NADP+)/methenyltetrahydrofolate cyclohydrolase